MEPSVDPELSYSCQRDWVWSTFLIMDEYRLVIDEAKISIREEVILAISLLLQVTILFGKFNNLVSITVSLFEFGQVFYIPYIRQNYLSIFPRVSLNSWVSHYGTTISIQ